MLPDLRLSACQADTHPTELPARQSQSLGWTKHFTSYKPKIIDPVMYFFFFLFFFFFFFFFWGVGRVRGFMVLQNYFTYFELNQSLCWAKSKDPYGKKQQHQITCTFHIYTRAIFPAFPPQTSHYDFEKPLNLSQKCGYSFSVIFTELHHCKFAVYQPRFFRLGW